MDELLNGWQETYLNKIRRDCLIKRLRHSDGLKRLNILLFLEHKILSVSKSLFSKKLFFHLVTLKSTLSFNFEETILYNAYFIIQFGFRLDHSFNILEEKLH